MKKFNVVSLTNFKQEYLDKNLYKNVKGIVLNDAGNNKYSILFFNDKNAGDFAIVNVDRFDLKKEKWEIPTNILEEIKKSKILQGNNINKKQSLTSCPFDECDFVELIVDDERYTKQGIHKGDTGVIALPNAIDDYVLVDFTGINEKGGFYGDCVSVKIKDLKLINKK